MTGLTAFRQMNLLDDDLIEESFDLYAGAPAKNSKSPSEGKIRQFMTSTWGVSLICAMVSLAVLSGIIWAGRGPFPGHSPAGNTQTESECSHESVDSAERETETAQKDIHLETAVLETETPTEGVLHDPITLDGLTYVSQGDGTCILQKADYTLIGEITVPALSPYGDKVSVIGTRAFQHCTGITSVILPEGVREIQSGAFQGCVGMQRVELPSTLTSLGTGVFQKCTALLRIELPDNITVLPRQTFETCTSLKTVMLGSKLEKIQENAFNGCSQLKILHIPATLQSVGNSAFLRRSVPIQV